MKRHLLSLTCYLPYSLKVEYDKLANEKTEMQRHYVMVRPMNFIFIFPENIKRAPSSYRS